MAVAFLFPRTRDLPEDDLAFDFEGDLLGDLAVFFTVLEGVVLRCERETVCLVALCFDLFFLLPKSSFRRVFFIGEAFAGFALGSLNFLIELFLAAGMAVMGLVRARLVERGITDAQARFEVSLLALLLILPASRSSKEISLTDFLG